MTSALPPALRAEATHRLPRPPAPDTPPAADVPAAADTPAAVTGARVTKPPRRRNAWELAAAARGRSPRELAGAVRRRAEAAAKARLRIAAIRTTQLGGIDDVRAAVEAVGADLAVLRRSVEALYDELRPLSVDLRLGRREVLSRVEVSRINQELLKSEIRDLLRVVEELGFAFAPATGIVGAGARFAELREAVNGLERRLRNLSITGSSAAATPPTTDPDSAAAAPPPRPDTSAPTSTLFDYVGFERRFRGDPDEIMRTLDARYGDLLEANQPVVDIGCGRAELLDRLAQRGVDVIGVEPDPAMVAEARARGVTVHEALAGDWLRDVEDSSLGSIISTHVAEHLQLDDLIEMIELSLAKLKPGGVFIAETPNPASLIVLGNSYILDPTHVWPLHPSLLAFLCESGGFRDVRLQFYSPADDYHLPLLDAPADADAPEWARGLASSINLGFGKLNDVLFGPQEYAVIAASPPAD
ncbi:MAG: class I SAM-dependent methyltransferase [Mycobacteriales bacterium]